MTFTIYCRLYLLWKETVLAFANNSSFLDLFEALPSKFLSFILLYPTKFLVNWCARGWRFETPADFELPRFTLLPLSLGYTILVWCVWKIRGFGGTHRGTWCDELIAQTGRLQLPLVVLFDNERLQCRSKVQPERDPNEAQISFKEFSRSLSSLWLFSLASTCSSLPSEISGH